MLGLVVISVTFAWLLGVYCFNLVQLRRSQAREKEWMALYKRAMSNADTLETLHKGALEREAEWRRLHDVVADQRDRWEKLYTDTLVH